MKPKVPESFKQHVPETITSLVPSELTTYNELDLRTSTNVWEWEPVPSDFAELTETFAIYMDENPCIEYYRRTGDGRATKISDFLTHRELRRLGYYNEYLRRVGLEHRMSIVIPKPPHSVIALGRTGKDFSERDRLLLDLLHPHLTQAYDNAAALTRMRQESVHPNPVKDVLLSRESFERLGLTDREAEILLGITRGQTNQQIAASLYVSPFTVKTHLQHVYRKLGVRSRTESLSRALEIPDLPGRSYFSGIASGMRTPSGTSSIGRPDAASMRPLKLKYEIRAVAS